MSIELKKVDGKVYATQPWPDATILMEGMIDGEMVKQATDDIIAITVANGHAEYQITQRTPDGDLTLELLPHSTFFADEEPAPAVQEPIKTVDASGKHIA